MGSALPPALTNREIWRAYWPLALSWFFMSLEGPVLFGFVARLPHPEINLAAFGGVAFPLSMIVEAPIIMLLSAATALVTDERRFRAVRRYSLILCGVLTIVHLALALTPLFDLVVVRILAVPPELHELVRVSLLVMTPWTPAIGYRRFYQGVLIRCSRPRDVTIGTAIRFTSVVAVMLICVYMVELPGAVAGSLAIISGVLAESVFAGMRGARAAREVLSPRPVSDAEMTPRAFVRFYTPLALTSMIAFLTIPLGTAALTRLPGTIESLAALPAVSAVSFMFRSFGHGINEVVIAHINLPGARQPLFTFSRAVGAVTSGVLLLLAATPAAGWWFTAVAGLRDVPLELAVLSIMFVAPTPYLAALHQFYQGTLVAAHRTTPITESVIVNLAVSAAIVAAAIAFFPYTGIYVWMAACLAALACQMFWSRRAAIAVPVAPAPQAAAA